MKIYYTIPDKCECQWALGMVGWIRMSTNDDCPIHGKKEFESEKEKK